jgi:hypothetical protein
MARSLKPFQNACPMRRFVPHSSGRFDLDHAS